MDSWLPYAVIYQVNLRTIAVREPRNPIEAALEKKNPLTTLGYVCRNLETIRELGVNVLHLMPPYPIGIAQRKGIGSPYAARDYVAVEREYGSLEDLAALVRKAHAMGFKVILGMVPNHTSRDHVWTLSHPEYYVHNGDDEIAYDIDWFDTAKLDYNEPSLREAMLNVYDYWLSFLGPAPNGIADGVDGFRIDMAHYINNLDFWNETTETLQRRHPDREVLFLAECYGMHNNLDLFARGFNAAYDDDFYKCCQYFYGMDRQERSLILPSDEAGENDHFSEKFNAFENSGIAGAFERALVSYEEIYRDDEHPYLARYTDNHDEGRGTYRFGAGAVRALNQLIFFSRRAIPFLLAGQEFGALNRPSIHERAQPCEKGRRVQEDDEVVYQDGIEFEGNIFARTIEERARWYAFYQELIHLRQNAPELVHGSFKLLDVEELCDADARSIVAFERKHENSAFHCAVNLGPEDRKVGKPDLLRGRLVYGGMNGDILPGFSAVVTRM